ncbi:dienelactone hydrolase family protein [Kitasatospora sp. NPDC048365]|uniref:dienelactone hydrolase family protein n=1 Tax=Kitasatospora sp. NPDC048365 TaxID=3364050 RepID=UPI00371B9270
MSDVIARDIEYWDEGTRLLGHLCAPAGGRTGAAVLLLPDAYGVTKHMIGTAQRLAEQGHPVFVADLWGEGLLPADQREFGPLIAAMAADRPRWMRRVRAAHRALLEQPETGAAPVAVLGYCFGGSSALEYTRTGHEVAGVIGIHPGLDTVAPDWSAAGPAPVLLCVGDGDPMGTAAMRSALTTAMTGAGTDWQLHLYGDTVHAFTSPHAKDSPRPDVVAYSARSTARAWDTTLRFLHGTDPARTPTH